MIRSTILCVERSEARHPKPAELRHSTRRSTRTERRPEDPVGKRLLDHWPDMVPEKPDRKLVCFPQYGTGIRSSRGNLSRRLAQEAQPQISAFTAREMPGIAVQDKQSVSGIEIPNSAFYSYFCAYMPRLESRIGQSLCLSAIRPELTVHLLSKTKYICRCPSTQFCEDIHTWKGDNYFASNTIKKHVTVKR